HDPEGESLKKLLCDSDGVQIKGLVSAASRPTTIKRSYFAAADNEHTFQKVFRVDREVAESVDVDRSEEGRAVVAELLEVLEWCVPKVDALCIADFGKGVCSPQVCRAAIDAARRRQIPIYVDPSR